MSVSALATMMGIGNDNGVKVIGCPAEWRKGCTSIAHGKSSVECEEESYENALLVRRSEDHTDLSFFRPSAIIVQIGDGGIDIPVFRGGFNTGRAIDHISMPRKPGPKWNLVGVISCSRQKNISLSFNIQMSRICHSSPFGFWSSHGNRNLDHEYLVELVAYSPPPVFLFQFNLFKPISLQENKQQRIEKSSYSNFYPK